MLDCIEGMQSEKGKYLVLSVENNGSIPGLADEDVIETTCLVSKDGIHPVRVEEVPEHCYLLIRLIKMYEKLTVEAVKISQRNRCTGVDVTSAGKFVFAGKTAGR